MSYGAKMLLASAFFFSGAATFVATVPTFGRRCAEAFKPTSAAYDRCVVRLSEGGSVHFVRKVLLVPVEEENHD